MLTLVTIHRIDGTSVSLPSIDAREAVTAHPAEWSYSPFSPEAIRAAELRAAADMQAVADRLSAETL